MIVDRSSDDTSMMAVGQGGDNLFRDGRQGDLDTPEEAAGQLSMRNLFQTATTRRSGVIDWPSRKGRKRPDETEEPKIRKRAGARAPVETTESNSNKKARVRAPTIYTGFEAMNYVFQLSLHMLCIHSAS